MRFLLLFLFLFVGSCSPFSYVFSDSRVPIEETAPSFSLISNKGQSIKQCDEKILYAISDNLPVAFHDIVRRGFDYWNALLEHKKFYYIGIVDYTPMDPETSGFIIIGVSSERDSNIYGFTKYDYDHGTGCMSSTKIFLTPSCLQDSDVLMESVVRHEIGHVLGFGHSKDEKHLMWYKIAAIKQGHPIDVSRIELDYALDLYGRINE